MNSRQQQITQIVNDNKRISVSKLSELLGVSAVTIRHDLNFLESEGHLKRTHGAAVSLNNDDLDSRLEVRFDTKQKLARVAAEQVDPNEAVMIEGGSANALVARILAERGDVTIITPSSYIAHLVRHTSANIILLGGIYQHQGESAVGPLTRLCIDHTHFSTAFIGIDGFDITSGFTSRDMMRADIAKHIISKQRRNIILTDSNKFGRIHSTSIVDDMNDISMLITDHDAPEDDISFICSSGIETVLV